MGRRIRRSRLIPITSRSLVDLAAIFRGFLARKIRLLKDEILNKYYPTDMSLLRYGVEPGLRIGRDPYLQAVASPIVGRTWRSSVKAPLPWPMMGMSRGTCGF